MTDELKQIADEIDYWMRKRKEIAKTKGEEIIAKILAPLFEYDFVHTVVFTGYIPSFNDGDPCVFNLRNDLVFNGSDESESWDEYSMSEYGIDLSDLNEQLRDGFSSWDSKYYSSNGETFGGRSAEQWEEFSKVAEEASRWIGENGDFVEEVFGSNFKVIALKDRLIVEDYDCGY